MGGNRTIQVKQSNNPSNNAAKINAPILRKASLAGNQPINSQRNEYGIPENF